MYPPFSATSDSPAPGNCSRLRGSHRDPAPGVVEQVGPPGPVIQRHQFGDMRLVVAVVQVAPGQSFGNDKLTRGGGESHDRDRTPTALGVRHANRSQAGVKAAPTASEVRTSTSSTVTVVPAVR